MPRKPAKSSSRKSPRRPLWVRLLKLIFYFFTFIAFLLVAAFVAAQINKDKILDAINGELKTVVNGDIEIGALNFTPFEKFPTFSISLSDIYLRGPRYDKYHQDFFNANKIYIDIEPIQLIRGTISLQSIRIKDANIFVFRASDGYANTDIVKTKKEHTQDSVNSNGMSPSLMLKSISLENVRIHYFDSVKRKSYGIDFSKTEVAIVPTDSSQQISVTGDMTFSGMMLNESKGAYLSNKVTHSSLNVELVKGKNGLTLMPSFIQFEKSKVELYGAADFTAPGTFTLNIHSPNLDYEEGTTIVTTALKEKLGKYNLAKPIDLKVKLVGSLGGGEPMVDIKFSTKGNHFTSGKQEIMDFDFQGGFINHVDTTLENGDPNSRLAFDSFSGKISGIPTRGVIYITHLNAPDLEIESHSRANLPDLNSQTDTTRLKFLSGEFKADVSYRGKLVEYLNHTETEFSGLLNGEVSIKNASWNMPPQQKKFERTDVSLKFNQDQMEIEKVDFVVNGSPVEISGQVRGFIPFFFEPEKKGYVKLNVHSPRLDLTPLIKKKTKSKTKAIANSKETRNKRISELIDVLYDKVEFDLALKIDALSNGNFQGSDLAGNVKFMKGQLDAGPLKMKTAGGSVALKVQLQNLERPVNDIRITANVNNVDIGKFFKYCDNFSQKSLRSENIKGKITTNVKLRGKIDEQFRLQMTSLSGNVDFKVKDCELRDFEPLQNMSNFLFKNRDFNHVTFAEIKSKLKVDSTSIQIERMEVESSVFFLFLEGTYSLSDDTDLSIQVPLKNLKKRAAGYKPENIGVDAKVGPSIFLRARSDENGKTVLAYDPFRKLRKKK